jgi:imidazolonepropionase-like amidohydrolase
VVFAGFWNTHVNFTGPQWDGAASRRAEELSRDMQAMLTHSDFSTVVDIASDPNNTVVLRRRIQNGEVAGPNIYTSGFALSPPHGIPFYLDDLPEKTRAKLQQPNTPAAAVEAVRENQAYGSDVVKLFNGSYLTPDNITHMPLEIAKAAVQAGHDHQQLVFAHPSDLKGVQIAIEGGVDVLAHAPDTIAGVDADLVNEMVSKRMATCSGVSRQLSSTQPRANRSMWRPLPSTLSAI